MHPTTQHVFVTALKLKARIGIHPHEKRRAQKIIIHARAEIAAKPARQIDETVCYEAIAARIRASVAGGHIDLVETLAENIAARLFADLPLLTLTLRIEKPRAIRGADNAGVEMAWAAKAD